MNTNALMTALLSLIAEYVFKGRAAARSPSRNGEIDIPGGSPACPPPHKIQPD
jgi:hypothetical protein